MAPHQPLALVVLGLAFLSTALARQMVTSLPVSPGQVPLDLRQQSVAKRPNAVAKLVGAKVAEIGEGKGKGQGVVYWPGIQGYDGDVVFNGGRVMTEALTVHLLFYGAWADNAGKDIDVVTAFINSLSDRSVQSPSVAKWWDLTTKYTDASGKGVPAKVSLGTVLVPGGAYKKTLNDMQNGKGDDMFGLVRDAIEAGTLPKDPNAIYFVLTSADITVGDSKKKYGNGFCAQYCGYHWNDFLADKTQITYSFIGSADQCPGGCSTGKYTKNGTPNGFSGVDNSISILAHELSEAATDAYGTGWYTAGGWENGDVCAWTFTDDQGYPTLLKAGAAYFNLHGAGGFKFLVQTIPDPIKQACLVQADSALAKKK